MAAFVRDINKIAPGRDADDKENKLMKDCLQLGRKDFVGGGENHRRVGVWMEGIEKEEENYTEI
jgi:hypothetical protein